MKENVGASPDGDRATRPSAQAPAGLGDTASVPSADDAFNKMWAAMCRRARLRAEWLNSMPKGHPMRVLATLRNTAACFMGRQAQSDRIDMMRAVEAAQEIEDEAFSQWREASAIEARSDATPKSGAAEGESAVAESETPNNNSPHSPPIEDENE